MYVNSQTDNVSKLHILFLNHYTTPKQEYKDGCTHLRMSRGLNVPLSSASC